MNIDYYDGRVTKQKKVSMTSVKKRREGCVDCLPHIPPKVPKVHATKQCCWCLFEFDRWRIRCPRCSNCQSCGLRIGSHNKCRLCLNSLPDDLKIEVIKKTIRVA